MSTARQIDGMRRLGAKLECCESCHAPVRERFHVFKWLPMPTTSAPVPARYDWTARPATPQRPMKQLLVCGRCAESIEKENQQLVEYEARQRVRWDRDQRRIRHDLYKVQGASSKEYLKACAGMEEDVVEALGSWRFGGGF